MSCQRPKEWISVVLSRLDKYLELSVAQDPCLSSHLENLKECIVNISQSKCSNIINGLANSLKKLSSTRIYGEQQELNLYNCQMTVLNLLVKCIQVDSVLPDDKVLTKQLLPEICQFLQQPACPDKPVIFNLHASASNVLYKISKINYQVVFNRIFSRIKELASPSNDESAADSSDLLLIQHIYLDLKRIKILIEEIVNIFHHLRRSIQQTLAASLDKTLWRWFCSSTTELYTFYKLYENNQTPGSQSESEVLVDAKQLSKSCERLFSLLDSMTEGSKKKASCYWPLQAVLICFCPDALASIANGENNRSKNNKLNFITQLRKCLHNSSSRSVHDSALESLTRMLKAATFIPKTSSKLYPIHMIVDSYLNELQEHLFENTSSRQVLRSCEQNILIECLVSSFRFKHDGNSPIIDKFASANSNLHHKIALIQSLHCVCNQPCLTWWPHIASLYSLGSCVRKIFLDCVKSNNTILSPRSHQQSLREKMNASLKRSHDEVHVSHKDILQLCVTLISSDPNIFLHSLSSLGAKKHSALREFIHGLLELVTLKSSAGIFNLQICCDSLDALLHLHDPNMNPRWFPDSLYFVFWDISTQVVEKFCDCFMNNDQISIEVARHALNWLHRIIACRFEFVSAQQDPNVFHAINKNAEQIIKTWGNLETILLQLLHHTDVEIVHSTLTCLLNLHEEAVLRWSFNEFAAGRSFPPENEIYNMLGSLTHIKVDKNYHEQVFSVFRKTYKFSQSTYQAWENTRVKWESKTNFVINGKFAACWDSNDANTTSPSCQQENKNNKKSLLTHQDIEEWELMSKYLCSLSGACINFSKPEPPTLVNYTRGKLSSTSSSTHQQFTSSSVLTSRHNKSSPINRPTFVDYNATSPSYQNVVKCLRCLIHQMYNGCKTNDLTNMIVSILGKYIHPSLYPCLFSLLNEIIETNVFNAADEVVLNRFNDRFVQNTIIILQNISMNSMESAEIFFNEISIESLILHIVRYIRLMEPCEITMKSKYLVSEMLFHMFTNKKNFFFLSEVRFKNKLVDILVNWLNTKEDDQSENDEVENTLMEESLVRTLSLLLQNLPLQPDDFDGGDFSKMKKQLFSKYFTIFMNLLPHKKQVKNDSKTAKFTVTTLCNLLSSNIEHGIDHAMSLTYKRDIRTRTALLEVLTRILRQGEVGGMSCFDALHSTITTYRFQRLVELVTMLGDNGELPIANALANVVHMYNQDELARVFVILFDAKHLLYHLLWNMFSKEVEDVGVHTVFRGSTLASKITTFCFKVYGASYLHNLLEPLVAWSLTPEISGLNFEVDERRTSSEGANLQECRNNLQRLADRFFTCIMRSTDKFPPQLKSVCHCLYQVVSQRFPDKGTGALASTIFLRFLNPAIVNPFENGLCDKKLPPGLLRGYKGMCKILQTIANHMIFTKEEHMKYFNEFVSKRFDACQQFFVQISTSESASNETTSHKPVYVDDSNITALHRLLWNEQSNIGNFLAKNRSAKLVGKKPYEKMVSLLAYLGPPEYTRPVLTNRFNESNSVKYTFEDIMEKRKVKDSEAFKTIRKLNIFYQYGRSKKAYPVFYFIARRFNNEIINEEVLTYYIITSLKPYINRKFDLVLDLTHAYSNNCFSKQFFSKWSQFMPEELYSNLGTLHIYNVTSWFQSVIENNISCLESLRGKCTINFIETLEVLSKFVSLEHQKVPASTRFIEEDCIVYSNINQNNDCSRTIVKINPKSMQFSQLEKKKFLFFEAKVNDVFYPCDIKEIKLYEEANTYAVKFHQYPDKWYPLPHIEAYKKVEELKQHYEVSLPSKDNPNHYNISAKDVPGALLNIALLNLGCSSPLVRSRAYNLLCALSSSFRLQIDQQLCESEGLCIPSNNVLFIVGISSTLAKREAHLTLEFLVECIAGFRSCVDKQKSLCFEYMEPWLFNLPYFLNSSPLEQEKVKTVIKKLIELTVDEGDFYPSVQTKIWGNFGKMPKLIDLILQTFIKSSIQNGCIAKEKAEAMADATVALAASNMKLVSSLIISRLLLIVDKTSLRPTPTLDKHKHWDEIAVLARCLLMLSFNNNLDVASHLPDLLHLVSILLSTGSISLRASIHGLVINIIHSLLTCRQLQFEKETRNRLKLILERFCLPSFYKYFGIANVQSAACTAFQQDRLHRGASYKEVQSFQSFQSTTSPSSFFVVEEDMEAVNLRYLDLVAQSFLEIMQLCMADSPLCQIWLSKWVELCEKFAYQYNPSLQPRALVVIGCISTTAQLCHVKKVLIIMGRSLDGRPDPILYEATLLAITRMQMVLKADNDLFCTIFWLGICAMQLNDKNMYIAGFSLLEGSLMRLNEMNAFSNEKPHDLLMKERLNAERFFQQLELVLDVSFKSHFHFAFCTNLLKGFRLNCPSINKRIVKLFELMLEIVAKANETSKYAVNNDSIAYLSVLLPVNKETEDHCTPRRKSPPSCCYSSATTTSSSRVSNGNHNCSTTPPNRHNYDSSDKPCRNKMISDCIPENVAAACSVSTNKKDVQKKPHQSRKSLRRNSRKTSDTSQNDSDCSTTSSSSNMRNKNGKSPLSNHSTHECSVLLDPEVLDHKSQALLLTMMATQVKYSRNYSDVKVLYQYLAEASIIFPNIFPIVHGLLDHKINNVLQHCDDPTVSSHVQIIVQNALLYSNTPATGCISPQTSSSEALHHMTFLQNFKFSGMWKFAGPFAKNSTLELASCVTNIINIFTTQSAHLKYVRDDVIHQAARATSSEEQSSNSSDNDHSELSDFNDNDPCLPDDCSNTKSFREKGPKLTIKLPPSN